MLIGAGKYVTVLEASRARSAATQSLSFCVDDVSFSSSLRSPNVNYLRWFSGRGVLLSRSRLGLAFVSTNPQLFEHFCVYFVGPSINPSISFVFQFNLSKDIPCQIEPSFPMRRRNCHRLGPIVLSCSVIFLSARTLRIVTTYRLRNALIDPRVAAFCNFATVCASVGRWTVYNGARDCMWMLCFCRHLSLGMC